MDRLRFGIFLAPFHPAGRTRRWPCSEDLELVEHLDRLGYDEAWINEHHSPAARSSPRPRSSSPRRPSAPGTSSWVPA